MEKEKQRAEKVTCVYLNELVSLLCKEELKRSLNHADDVEVRRTDIPAVKHTHTHRLRCQHLQEMLG